jgi:hypothetical protein
MFRHITAGLAVAVGIGSMVYALEPVNDSSAAPDAPAITQTVQATESETKSPDEQLVDLKGKVDGLDEPLAAIKSTVDKLSKIKISGYAQFQVRSVVNYKDATDTAGTGKAYGTYKYAVGDFAGGKFGDRMGSVIQLRRARIKVAYESDLSQAVVQFDCVPFLPSTSTSNSVPLPGTVLTWKLITIATISAGSASRSRSPALIWALMPGFPVMQGRC